MGLFKALTDIVAMPVRVGIDVVKLPLNVGNGDDLFENTVRGIKKIEKDLDE